MLVFLTGATGFVGGYVLKQLLAAGHSVRALVRDPAPAKLPAGNRTELVRGDIVEASGLNEGMQGCEAVIHLVGIITETGKNTFENVHHIGTHNLVEAAQRNGISRFVQMSALGVRADGVSEYQTSKWKGEEKVRQSGISYCILRPSLIFGPGSGFVRQMLDIMRKAPIFRPVPGSGKPRFRPIYVQDVAACFVQALSNPEVTNKTVELGGGDELSLNEVLQTIADAVGIRKPAVHVPMPLMFVGAAMAQTFLPHPPVTVGQLRMLKEGSTCDLGPMIAAFGIQPVGFRVAMPQSLRRDTTE